MKNEKEVTVKAMGEKGQSRIAKVRASMKGASSISHSLQRG